MGTKKVLIIGSGGREHALGWKIAQSDEVSEVLYAPGNAGTASWKGRNVPIDGSKEENFASIAQLIESEDIDMTVVGPEAPLCDGLVDYLNFMGHYRVFGPTKKASVLESDKFFSYDIMYMLDIPQADSKKCYSTKEEIDTIKSWQWEDGVVIKARGLTGGKGVSVCDSKEEALAEMANHSKNYGPEVLIAERLHGQEFSVFGISDGNRVAPLEISVQDHKPLHDDDKGPNTGGMGAYCPVPIAPANVVKYVAEKIMTPIVQLMKKDGREYKGFLYAGMMMTADGPKVIEFNVRFGDPECQPAMMMLKNDLYAPLSLALEGRLDEISMEFNPGAACCVVLASQGYPGSYKKDLPISGLEKAKSLGNVKVFHAGTKLKEGGIVNSGGRVLGATAWSASGIAEAQKRAYGAVSLIDIPGGFHYRKDIANKALNSSN
jgi:phosphoribosylamine--glycine ligase